jgi:hypothetical protein
VGDCSTYQTSEKAGLLGKSRFGAEKVAHQARLRWWLKSFECMERRTESDALHRYAKVRAPGRRDISALIFLTFLQIWNGQDFTGLMPSQSVRTAS